MVGMFAFLNKKWPDLALSAKKAEESLNKNPNECMQKTGFFIEKLINEIIITEFLANKSNRLSFVDRIKLLEDNDLLTQDITNDVNMIRVVRNQAVHSEYNSHSMAEAALIAALNIAKWFMQNYGDWTFELDIKKGAVVTNCSVKSELMISEHTNNKSYDNELNNLWSEILSNLLNNKTEFHTIPKGKRQPVWFSAVAEGNDVIVDKSNINKPSSNLSGRRKLTFKDFQKIYPIYLKRESGQSVSKEAIEATVNQVYFYSIIKNILPDTYLKGM